jgi:hypothetical protein
MSERVLSLTALAWNSARACVVIERMPSTIER